MSNRVLKIKSELRDRKQQDGQNCIMKWTAKVASMKEMRIAHAFWSENLKSTFGRRGRRRQDNIKIEI
jgi:hypothetical protein